MHTRASTYDYRSRLLINQRGGTIYINNSTGREQVRISQHSGSNISITNAVNSELATHNKQTKVIYDEFETIGNNRVTAIGNDRILRVTNNNYELLGYSTGAALSPMLEIGVHYRWREDYRPVAEYNSWFDVYRGGYSKPNGITTEQVGSRASNPDLKFKGKALFNETSEVTPTPIRRWNRDDVSKYRCVKKRKQKDARTVSPTVNDIEQAFGKSGTNAPGVIEFGAAVSSATEDGNWAINEQKNGKIIEEVLMLYQVVGDPGDEKGLAGMPEKKLLPLEQRMGVGGDSIVSVKRHKIDNIGTIVNNYPSIRIDDYGRSQPTEVGVSGTRVIKHHDYVPHVEDISNDENFPCGNYTLTVGNKYDVLVGSGGMTVNTTGPMTIGCTSLRAACTRVDVNASHGIIIGSASHVDIYAPKIQIRSKRQVLVDTSLGVTNNAIIGGGMYVEGELYTHHITAPLEIQQTEKTEVWGTTNRKQIVGWTFLSRNRVIGRVTWTQCVVLTNYDEEGNPTGDYVRCYNFRRNVFGSGRLFPTYGSGRPDAVQTYPHSHHFHNLPLRLMESNKALRNHAAYSGINIPSYAMKSSKMAHRRKKKQPDPGVR